MSTKRQRKCGTWEYRFVKKKLFRKPIYMTFESENQGDRFARRIDDMLRNGVLPNEFKQIIKHRRTVSKRCRRA